MLVRLFSQSSQAATVTHRTRRIVNLSCLSRVRGISHKRVVLLVHNAALLYRPWREARIYHTSLTFRTIRVRIRIIERHYGSS